jgi:hypothetical protein
MRSGQCEWDEQVLRTCMYLHDVEAMLRIRLSERIEPDFVAWFYEKSGLFTVKSAYHLAVKLEHDTGRSRRDEGSSACADGRRSLHKEIWKTNVPQKVRIFAWRLSQEGLATQENRKRRTLVENARCTICGWEDESGYHATIRCTKAWALRLELRKHWMLPEEAKFTHTGPDWLQILLTQQKADMKAKILLMLWRARHLRNDTVHGPGTGSTMGSTHFLVNYWETLANAQSSHQVQVTAKGKEVLSNKDYTEERGIGHVGVASMERPIWKPPAEGWATVNTDVSYCEQTGSGGTGIVIRDHGGRVLLTA